MGAYTEMYTHSAYTFSHDQWNQEYIRTCTLGGIDIDTALDLELVQSLNFFVGRSRDS